MQGQGFKELKTHVPHQKVWLMGHFKCIMHGFQCHKLQEVTEDPCCQG